jgi:cell pole-organizing protein PopZ
MKNGQKTAEPRMEDVLASIRRAIDENAHDPAPDRLGGSMAEFRVKFDAPANQETRPRRSYDPPAPAGTSSAQGFAGILSGRKGHGEGSPSREAFKPREPAARRLEPVPPPKNPVPPPKNGEGQRVYDGYYGAQVADYPEPVAPAEPYQAAAPLSTNPPRYLPLPPPAIAGQRQSLPPPEKLLSEASSDATQAAFARLAEALTRRALGERPIADITQEMLRGMLKQWLDENLPKIVERLVREEIERVVRRPR